MRDSALRCEGLTVGRPEVLDRLRRGADRDRKRRDRASHHRVRPDERALADIGHDRALARDGRVVADPNRREVVALVEHRPVEVTEPVVSVNDDRRLPEHAAAADLDRGRALHQHVVGEDRPRADLDPPALELGAEAAPELDARADYERAPARYVEREPRAEVDGPGKADVRMRMPEQNPALAEPRHQPRSVVVADRARELARESADPIPRHSGSVPRRPTCERAVRASTRFPCERAVRASTRLLLLRSGP